MVSGGGVWGSSAEEVLDVRRALFNARELWYPNMLQLYGFMVSVNHDGRGGSALDPLVWDQGSRLSSVGLILGSMYASRPSGFLERVLGFRFRVGAFPVLILLPGHIVSVCCANSLLSQGLCIGRLVLRIWGILVFPTWRVSFSLSNGLVIGCSVRRSLVLMYVHTVFMCQKESKFGRDAASLAAWKGPW